MKIVFLHVERNRTHSLCTFGEIERTCFENTHRQSNEDLIDAMYENLRARWYTNGNNRRIFYDSWNNWQDLVGERCSLCNNLTVQGSDVEDGFKIPATSIAESRSNLQNGTNQGKSYSEYSSISRRGNRANERRTKNGSRSFVSEATGRGERYCVAEIRDCVRLARVTP